jgi:hypothetical protein
MAGLPFYILEGLPSDLLTSDRVGERKLKVDAAVNLGDIAIDQPQNGLTGAPAPDTASLVGGVDLDGNLAALLIGPDGLVVDTGLNPLTDAQLRAAPVAVDIGIGDSQADAVFVRWNGTQAVTVQGEVEVKNTTGASLAVDTGLIQPTTPADTQPVSIADTVSVRDDFAGGEILPDQTGANDVLTFTFSEQVDSFWVAVVGNEGVVKVHHYGGTPSATSGIPVAAGGVMPFSEPATTVRVFAPTGLIVTVWGQTRA